MRANEENRCAYAMHAVAPNIKYFLHTDDDDDICIICICKCIVYKHKVYVKIATLCLYHTYLVERAHIAESV